MGKSPTEPKDELHFQPDLVIVAMCENVAELATDEARDKFAVAFAKLLSVLKEHGQPTIFVRSSFWPHEVKDGILRKASAEAGITFVDISELGRDKSNAGLSTTVPLLSTVSRGLCHGRV